MAEIEGNTETGGIAKVFIVGVHLGGGPSQISFVNVTVFFPQVYHRCCINIYMWVDDYSRKYHAEVLRAETATLQG